MADSPKIFDPNSSQPGFPPLPPLDLRLYSPITTPKDKAPITPTPKQGALNPEIVQFLVRLISQNPQILALLQRLGAPKA